MAKLSFLKHLRKGQFNISNDIHSFPNEHKFKALFENHLDAVLILDLEGRIQCFNESATELYGFTIADIKSKCDSFYNGNLIEKKKYLHLALKGKSQNFQAVAQHKNGRNFHVDITYIPIVTDNMEVNGLYKIVKDITVEVEREQEARKIKDSLELAQQVGKMGSWDFDLIADEIYWSNQMFELTGREKTEDFVPTFEEALFVVVHPEDREKYRKIFQHAMKHSQSYSIDYRIIREDGSFLYVTEQAEVMLDETNNPIRYVGVLQDITKRKLAEQKLNETEERFEYIYNNLEVGIWSFDVKANEFILITKGIEIITGYSPDDFQERLSWDSLIHPEDFPAFQSIQGNLRNGEVLHHQYRIIHRNGEVLWIQDQTLPIIDANGDLIRIDGIVSNITSQKEYEKRIHHLAYYDSITNLPNRALFEEKIQSLINTKTSFSILYLDLDRFHIINESLGHQIGDQLLQKFSERINQFLSKQSLFAKMSGDEFGIILWGYDDLDYPVSVAKSIVESLCEPFLIKDYELVLTTSIGITTYPTNGSNIEELVKNAAAALYRAKAVGKNNYHIYSSTLNINTYKQYDLERDLRKSIDNEQLLIHFQPRVDALTGRIVSAEALVRWEHPVWGLVSPGEFIPLAEETGFINEIGDWVLKQVCRNLKQWKNESLQIVPISINISAQRFLKNDWEETFIKTLEEHNIEPSYIELEITETTLIKHEKEVENAFKLLKEFGTKVALDDFGTGYSSLSYIKNYPIDTIKIDQSFIKQITKSENVEIIIKSLIFMAKGLQMNVVAEGVETIEQLRFLKQQECHEIQGYIFSKPVPETTFQSLLKKMIIKPRFRSEKSELTDRRKYYRVQSLFPLSAQMTLTSIQGKQVELGKTEIIVEDIGPGGLRFLSNMHLPIRPDVLFELETMLMGQVERVNGHIVWKEEVKGIFQYGLEFLIDEPTRDCLIKKLNSFSLQLRDNPLLPGCNFIREDKYGYLKKMTHSK